MSHSVLPPSSIKRVIRCPASAKINAEADRKSNIAAARGTQIHEMVEMRLKNRLDGITLSDYWLDKECEVDGFNFTITKDDIKMADTYVDYVTQRKEELNGKLLIEERGQAPEIHEEIFGTVDALILGEGNRMAVIDFKTGGWPVDVILNEQLMCYSLFALSRYGNEDTVVEMTIVQPNKKAWHKDGQIRSFDIQAVDLVDWGFNILKPACDEAMSETPSFNAGEEWCRFCAYKSECNTYKNLKEN